MLNDQQILHNFALFAAQTQMIHDDEIWLDTVEADIHNVFGTLKYSQAEIDTALEHVRQFSPGEIIG